jgi:hypothetical protein
VLFDFGAVRKFPQRYIDPFSRMVFAALTENRQEVIQMGIKLGFLKDNDSFNIKELFWKICQTAVEPFAKEYESPDSRGDEEGPNPYDWSTSDLLVRLTHLAKDAVFAFKLRTPPREAIFLDRKMVGTFVILSKLKLRHGPRQLILKYVTE